jgi:hypothetical protein
MLCENVAIRVLMMSFDKKTNAKRITQLAFLEF